MDLKQKELSDWQLFFIFMKVYVDKKKHFIYKNPNTVYYTHLMTIHTKNY